MEIHLMEKPDPTARDVREALLALMSLVRAKTVTPEHATSLAFAAGFYLYHIEGKK